MSMSKKRLFIFSLSMLMAVAMAVPSFAATYSPYLPAGRSYNYLNVNRSSTSVPISGKSLTLYYTTAPSTDQNFYYSYESVGGYAGFVLKLTANPAYAVNRNSSTSGAIMYTWQSSSNMPDSALNVASADYYTFQLRYGAGAGRYLLYRSNSAGSAVAFGGSGSSNWS